MRSAPACAKLPPASQLPRPAAAAAAAPLPSLDATARCAPGMPLAAALGASAFLSPGLVTRAANFSPRGAPLSAAGAPTGVAVVSTGGLKLGAKGLDAP